MRLLKKIILANEIDGQEMALLRGGVQMRSNNNEATECNCSGSSNGHWYCNDNSNSASSCDCTGNGNNTNAADSCKCQGDNDNTNKQTSCSCQ